MYKLALLAWVTLLMMGIFFIYDKRLTIGLLCLSQSLVAMWLYSVNRPIEI